MDIKAIFFDLGNVLVSVNGKKALETLRGKCSASAKEIASCFKSTRFEQYELGILSTRDFFEGLKEALVFDGTIENLREICSDIFEPIEKNITLAYATSKRYPLGVLSNTNHAHIDFIHKRYEVLNMFAVRIYSYEEGVRKPDSRIYELAVRALKVTPEQSLLIDDLAENVNAARDLRWNAIHYVADLDLEEAMRSYGVFTG
jgi:FMN phosphatase YigB (HAD superfamily)